MSYSISGYNQMITDRVRVDAYTRALGAAVRQGSVVAEVGTGSGYFAVLACKLGAARVFALEPDRIIDVARKVAEKNGCSDRIEFVEGLSTATTLPRKVDVVVSDLRGILPFFQHHIPTIIDARRRFLRPGGILMPARDDLFAAFVGSSEIHSEFGDGVLRSQQVPDMSPLRRTLRNSWSKKRVKPGECVSEYLHLGTIDYATTENANFKSAITWKSPSRTTTHGVCVWFDTILIDDIGFSNAPSAPEAMYSQAFFPFADPLELEEGDVTTVSFSAFLVGDDYLWRWETAVLSGGEFSHTKTEFRQSTIDGAFLNRDHIHRRRNDYVPPRGENVDLFRFVLERVDGHNSLDLIAHDLTTAFPARFADFTEALTFAGSVVEKSR